MPSPEEVYDPYQNSKYGEVITAMVTPFDEEGELDLDATEELIHRLQETGTQGIVVAGTTGEAPVLSEAEHLTLVSHVLSVAEVPILVGAGSNSTATAIAMTREARRMSSFDPQRHGFLHVTPYYNRPTQEGVEAHFKMVAEAVPDTDVVLYDIAGRTGTEIEEDTIARLAEVDNIVGLKDAHGDLLKSKRVIDRVDSKFKIYSGNDNLNLAMRRLGAVGVISVASHWVGEMMAEQMRALTEGDIEGAEFLDELMKASYEFESTAQMRNPMPAKAMMRFLGLSVGECRMPLMPTGEAGEAAAQVIMEDIEGIDSALGEFLTR